MLKGLAVILRAKNFFHDDGPLKGSLYKTKPNLFFIIKFQIKKHHIFFHFFTSLQACRTKRNGI